MSDDNREKVAVIKGVAGRHGAYFGELPSRRDALAPQFESMRRLMGGRSRRYVVGAMFTAAYSKKAERLAASCEKFGLSYDIHEVPTVHNSISNLGTADLSYTKPQFIRHLLEVHKKPVLYVDADCEFLSEPTLIDGLLDAGCDFAIYNWLADERTDCYLPIEPIARSGEPSSKSRFYRFVGSVDWFTTSQLQCSGCVQFYRNSLAARTLLQRWHQTIAAFPGCADDSALNFTFNNQSRRGWLTWLLKARWLPKSYARNPWWIYVEPIINHPDPPAKFSFTGIRDPQGRKEYYYSSMEKRMPADGIRRDCIIDTEQHEVCELVDGQIVPIEHTDQRFWL